MYVLNSTGGCSTHSLGIFVTPFRLLPSFDAYPPWIPVISPAPVTLLLAPPSHLSLCSAVITKLYVSSPGMRTKLLVSSHPQGRRIQFCLS